MLRLGWAETKIHISRAANEKRLLTSATRGGSCVHPDQSHDLARKALVRNDLCAGASPPILPFFLGGGVALHEGLMRERPIGVTILAILAGIAAIIAAIHALQFLGIIPFFFSPSGIDIHVRYVSFWYGYVAVHSLISMQCVEYRIASVKAGWFYLSYREKDLIVGGAFA